MREWHHNYADDGLTIIGIHTPSCNLEKEVDALAELIPLLEIPYPVAADNQRKTWVAYQNRYWPALYLIDKAGHLRFVKAGAGNEPEVEALVRTLLNEPSAQ